MTRDQLEAYVWLQWPLATPDTISRVRAIMRAVDDHVATSRPRCQCDACWLSELAATPRLAAAIAKASAEPSAVTAARRKVLAAAVYKNPKRAVRAAA